MSVDTFAANLTLSNEDWAGLGIYMGLKASYRREEMARFGLDYDTVVANLTKIGVIKNKRINKALAKQIWESRFPGQLTSQTHQYMPKLGIVDVRFS